MCLLVFLMEKMKKGFFITFFFNKKYKYDPAAHLAFEKNVHKNH